MRIRIIIIIFIIFSSYILYNIIEYCYCTPNTIVIVDLPTRRCMYTPSSSRSFEFGFIVYSDVITRDEHSPLRSDIYRIVEKKKL